MSSLFRKSCTGDMADVRLDISGLGSDIDRVGLDDIDDFISKNIKNAGYNDVDSDIYKVLRRHARAVLREYKNDPQFRERLPLFAYVDTKIGQVRLTVYNTKVDVQNFRAPTNNF